MAVPLNVPWRSMLQQMRVLPSWLDPPTMSSKDAGRLVVPRGYAVSLFATGVAEARGLRVTARGDVLVSSPRDGQVVLLEADRDDDGLADGRRVLIDGLNGPTGRHDAALALVPRLLSAPFPACEQQGGEREHDLVDERNRVWDEQVGHE